MLAIGFAYGVLSNVRDEFLSDAVQERFYARQLLPDLALSTWIIVLFGMAVFVLIEAGYRKNKGTANERDKLWHELIGCTTPKLEIIFNPSDVNHFPPPEEISNQIYSSTYERLIAVTIKNASSNTIRKMELFCEKLEVVNQGSFDESCLLIAAGASNAPRDLVGLEPQLCGVVRENWSEQVHNREVITRSFDVLCPLKCRPTDLRGMEFRMKLIAFGEGTSPVEAWFFFGERNKAYFFEREH